MNIGDRIKIIRRIDDGVYEHEVGKTGTIMATDASPTYYDEDGSILHAGIDIWVDMDEGYTLGLNMAEVVIISGE